MSKLILEFDCAPNRIVIDGVEWKPAPPKPDPPAPSLRPVSAPPVGSPVPTFAEAGLSQTRFTAEENHRIFAIRPSTPAFDNTNILKNVGTCIWGTSPGTPSGNQLRKLAPWIKVPGYTILHTAMSDEQFDAWSEWAEGNKVDPAAGTLVQVGKIDGNERYWANIFNDHYREWAFGRLRRLSERPFDGILADMAYNDVPPGKVNRDAWQHAVGSFLREVYKHFLEPKGKLICANVSNFRADRCEIITKYVGGVYLDRSFTKSELNVYNLNKACIWNEKHRKEWPDYWSIQDSHASDGNDPKWKMGDYCRWLIRMSVLGGWQGKHFLALRNNDAEDFARGSHSRIEEEHFVPAAVMHDMGKPVKDSMTWPKGFGRGLLQCKYEGGAVYTLATKGRDGVRLEPFTFKFETEQDFLHFDSWSAGTQYTLHPGEGVILKR